MYLVSFSFYTGNSSETHYCVNIFVLFTLCFGLHICLLLLSSGHKCNSFTLSQTADFLLFASFSLCFVWPCLQSYLNSSLFWDAKWQKLKVPISNILDNGTYFKPLAVCLACEQRPRGMSRLPVDKNALASQHNIHNMHTAGSHKVTVAALSVRSYN